MTGVFEGRNNWFLRHPFVTYSVGLSCIWLGIALYGLNYLFFIQSEAMKIVVSGIMVVAGAVAVAVCIVLDSYTWVCSRCGRESLSASKYCTDCGGLMVLKKREIRKCPNGHRVNEYVKFCPKCGEKVYDSDPQ